MTVVSGQPFEFVGGNLALDFVNTSYSGRDYLAAPGAIEEWARAAALGTFLISARPSFALLEFRANLASIATALTLDEPIAPNLIEQLNEKLSAACAHLTVSSTANGSFEKRTRFQHTTIEDIAGTLAAAMAELLSSPARLRVKQCPGCAMFFIDESRNRTRTWCSMKACGNRAKVSAHYQRSRRESGTGRP